MRQCISYPKSGRSWLRYMIGLCAPQTSMIFQHDGFEFNNGARPPHNFDLDARRRKYASFRHIVYLDRDPRDVVVSLYHQVTGRFRDYFHYEGDISSFIRDPYFGAPVLARFRAMWSDLEVEFGFLRISYEELHSDTAGVLIRVAKYWDCEISSDMIAKAVEAGRFEQMRELERSEAFPEPWLRPRNGHPKVRRGRVGGHVDDLNMDDQIYLNEVFGLSS